MRYIHVILPLAVDKLYSYAVPDEMGPLSVGCRVEVQFGKRRHYAAIVAGIKEESNPLIRTKTIVQIIDSEPIVDALQLKLWEWMADYYVCSMGELMIAALPSIFKLSSESVLMATDHIDEVQETDLSDEEYLITEALQIRQQIGLEDARLILQKEKVWPVLESLIAKNILVLREEMKNQYRPKHVEWLRLAADYDSTEDWDRAFDLLSRSPAQTDTLLQFIQHRGDEPQLPLRRFVALSGAKRTHINSLVERGILILEKVAVNRMLDTDLATRDAVPMDAQQIRALAEIQEAPVIKPIVLHGVTGSGKTRLYLELIREQIAAGRQVLYLLPEIALTTQIELRLREVLGRDIISYHSRLGPQERVDAWRLVQQGFPVILAARSGVFLPFQNLGLVIVDESHDSSYKQQNPAPRYHGRDVAVVLSRLHDCRCLMGTATPSMESLGNVSTDKYQLVEMPERHGDSILPEIRLIDLKGDRPLDLKTEIFSQTLLDQIQEALSRKRQVILFQNRRGYAPLLLCSRCDWKAECVNCDVSLTVHKYKNLAQCHYCNYKIIIPESCPKCQGQILRMTGFGTQKIVEELEQIFPGVSVDRLDYDTARTRSHFQKIIDRFTYGESQILVGTQMITKGLDFDHVAVVGILQADQGLFYPDFRATERAYQLFLQVAGRAGRRAEQGLVIIQTLRPSHPVFSWLSEGNYQNFADAELQERQQYNYPPYVRLIRITGKHGKALQSYQTTQLLIDRLRQHYGHWVSEIAPGRIPRIKNRYIYQFLLKIPRGFGNTAEIRRQLQFHLDWMAEQKDHRRVRFSVDVDPVF